MKDMTGSVVVPALGYCLNGFILIWESLDNKYKPNQFDGPTDNLFYSCTFEWDKDMIYGCHKDMPL